ncbi:MAG: ATP-binding cassette domain-containing protein [Peptococcaceae bacterium]
MKSEPIIEAREISFSYADNTRALDKISLSILRGKKTAFLGPNGAGKTTLFLHFNGILKPNQGKICYDGQEVRYNHASLLNLRKNVGIVFQDPETQLFSASVWQEISFGPVNLGLPKEMVRERVNQAMAETGITDLKDKPTHFLSYGQKKRVAIADILVMQPRILICDEPTAWLDVKYAAHIMELFDLINRTGVTIIFSTHDVDLAYSWADYVYLMKNGRIIGEGIPEHIFYNRRLLAEAELDRPWLVDIYEELKRKGWVASNVPPSTKQELIGQIREINVLATKG